MATSLTLLRGDAGAQLHRRGGRGAGASIRRGGLILAVLVLPLMIPTLIFGVSAAQAASGGTVPFLVPLAVLVALTLIAAVVGTSRRRRRFAGQNNADDYAIDISVTAPTAARSKCRDYLRYYRELFFQSNHIFRQFRLFI